MTRKVRLHVNGQEQQVDVDPRTPLIYVLRNDLALNSPKYGCGQRQCGSCMVLMDGVAEYTCTMPVAQAEGRKIVTLEGLVRDGRLHPVQQAFIDEQAAQCGYCTSGMIITAVALLDKHPHATEAQVREAMSKVLCRCGTYSRVARAISRVARREQP